MLEAVSDLRPLPWLETLRRIEALPSLDPVDWAIAAVAFHAGVEAAPGMPLHYAIGRAYLDRLCAACAVRVEPIRMRVVPVPIIVQSGPNGAVPVVTPPASVQKPSVPTITEVFEAWSTFEKREPKLVDEWRTASGRVVALNGDLQVDEITATMVRDYHRTCAGLPSRPPKNISSLPLREEVEVAAAEDLRRCAPDTVNKALSGSASCSTMPWRSWRSSLRTSPRR